MPTTLLVTDRRSWSVSGVKATVPRSSRIFCVVGGVVSLERDLAVPADRDRMQVVEEAGLDAGIEPPADLRGEPRCFGCYDLSSSRQRSVLPGLVLRQAQDEVLSAPEYQRPHGEGRTTRSRTTSVDIAGRT